MSNSTSTVSDHLNNLATLSNQVSAMNTYVSTSILMMISQIRGIQSYVNQSWQDCLNQLNNATQLEMTLVFTGNVPSLAFTRSSELLAMHLLLIHSKFQEQSVRFLYLISNYAYGSMRILSL